MRGPYKRYFVLAAAAVVALACQAQETATEQGSDATPAVDAAAVREAISAKDQAFAESFSAGDAAGLASQYAPEAIVLPPNGERIEGQAAIQETFAGMLAEIPGTSLSLTTNEVEVAAAGDYAYGTGSYSMTGPAPDGTEWSDQGKYLAVWKNIDGDWKMVMDTWNSDNPVPGTEAEAATE